MRVRKVWTGCGPRPRCCGPDWARNGRRADHRERPGQWSHGHPTGIDFSSTPSTLRRVSARPPSPDRPRREPGQNGCLCGLDPERRLRGAARGDRDPRGSPTWVSATASTRSPRRRATSGSASTVRGRPTVRARRSSTTARPGGREFLRIPTYGQVVDEDPLLRASEWKTFWILWQAGVRVLLVGGTSGSCDWRRTAADEDAVRPGDLVLPRSYLARDTMPTGLPGTELEFCLPRQVAIMDDPFCPRWRKRSGRARPLPGFQFRRIHGPEAGWS